MTSHLGLLIVFSLLVSSVFAALMRDEPREQIGVGAMMFAAFTGAALLAGWLMYPFPW